MAKDVDILTRFATANDEAVGYINRVDTATSKFRKGPRKGSIVKAAQGNLFEFPVFISNTIPLDYATATTSLLEQIYATYLQMAMSINPIIDADDSARGVQFANYKTNTNKYLEYTDTTYQHDVCHAEYINEEVKMEFDLLSIEDKEAQLINEAYDYQPLSEFDHYFQEAQVDTASMLARLYPIPSVNANGVVTGMDQNKHEYNVVVDPEHVQYGTVYDIRQALQDAGATNAQIDTAIANLDNTMQYYNLPFVSAYTASQNTSASDTADMARIQALCGMMTPSEFRKLPEHADILNIIRDLNNRNPGFEASMNATMRNVEQARIDLAAQRYRQNVQAGLQAAQTDAQRAYANAQNAAAAKTNAEIGKINDAPSFEDAEAARRNKAVADAKVAQRNADRFHMLLDDITKTGQAANQWASAASQGVNAVTNLASMRSTIKQRKADAESKAWDAAHKDEINARQWTDTYARTKTSGIQYVDDSKCAKMNTMKPLLMKVTLNRLNKNDSLQPIEYVVGVKCHTRMVQASILPEVAKYPLKEMDKISRKVKWRAGELKFFKDLVFRIKEKKQTAADSRDPNRKWYRRLYELAHMKGDAPAAAVVEGKSLFKVFIKDKQGKGNLLNGMIPNASIIMSQADVDNIKAQTEIDLLKPSAAKKFCGELFLISLIIIDTDRESIKILLPDINGDYDVHSLAAVNKQLATLDTMGSKTRDMFKLLGK